MQLEKIVIRRDGDSWILSRERKKGHGGESIRTNELEAAFDYVRAIYDKHGNYTQLEGEDG